MEPAPSPQIATNRSLLLAYFLPYGVYVGAGSLADLGLDRTGVYALRLAATVAVLGWGWRRYVPLRGPRPLAGSIGAGAAVGLLATPLWVGLALPLAPPAAPAWGSLDFGLRLTAAVTVVPLFEELLMRGYALRLAVQWDRSRRAGDPAPLRQTLDLRSVNEVEPGAWTVPAVAISTVLFAAGHASWEWPAALVYGVLMAGLWIVRRDLLSCVVAHAVTNLALGLWVAATGHWQLW